jgi:hypothetical protein
MTMLCSAAQCESISPIITLEAYHCTILHRFAATSTFITLSLSSIVTLSVDSATNYIYCIQSRWLSGAATPFCSYHHADMVAWVIFIPYQMPLESLDLPN